VKLGGAALGWTRTGETDAEGRRVVVGVEDEARTVERIVVLRADGLSLREITRSSLVRALVLREIGLADDASGPGPAPKKRPASTAQRGGERPASRSPRSRAGSDRRDQHRPKP
jgi:hypothetical protein